MDSTPPDSASAQQPPPREIQAVVAHAIENAARTHRIATAARTELTEQLAADDLRALADTNPELETQLARVGERLAREQAAAEQWQKKLGAASKTWTEHLAGPGQ